MVALNPDFAPSKPETDAQNRVGGFFSLAAERVGSDQSPSRIATKEKSLVFTILVSGRPFWPNRDPIGERGGLNPYASNLNNSINYWDYLGMIPCSDCPPCQIEETRYNNANNALDATVAILTATQNQLTNDTNAVNQANTNHAQRFVSLAAASISVVSACNSNGSDDADSSGACAVAAANLALQFSAFTNAQDALDAANIQLQLTISYLDTLGDQYDVDLREFLDANAVLAACRSDRLTCLADCCP